MRRAEQFIRAVCVLGVLVSVAVAGMPVARHMAGVVVLDAVSPPDMPEPTARDHADLTSLLQLAPFGRAAPSGAQTQPETATRPDIVLRGVFAGRGAASTALLDVAGVPGLYRETMQVADQLTVTQIAQDRVELMDGATVITLRFDAEAEAREGVNAVTADAPPLLSERLKGGFVVPARYEKPGQPETTAEYIDYWRHRIRKNPAAVLDEIGLRPTERGYVIADRHDVGVRLAGLRSGDLVRSVNGQPVGNPDTDRQFYDQIAAAGQARIEVERAGRVLSFSFPLR